MNSPTLARLRRALRKDRFAWLVHLLAWIWTGLFERYVDPEEDFEVLTTAFQPSPGFRESDLRELSQLLAPEVLRRAMNEASTADLEMSRAYLNYLLRSLCFWLTPQRVWNVENRIGKRGAELLSRTIQEPCFWSRGTRLLLLACLSVLSSGGKEGFFRFVAGSLPMGGWPIEIQ